MDVLINRQMLVIREFIEVVTHSCSFDLFSTISWNWNKKKKKKENKRLNAIVHLYCSQGLCTSLTQRANKQLLGTNIHTHKFWPQIEIENYTNFTIRLRALVRYERCQNTCYFLLLLSLSGTCRYDNWADSVRFADYRKKDQCTWAPLHAPLSQEISRTSDNRIAQTQRYIRLDPVVICCPCPRHLQRKTLHQAIVLLVERHENPMLLEYGARGCCGRGREYRVSSDGERFVPKREISMLFYYVR